MRAASEKNRHRGTEVVALTLATRPLIESPGPQTCESYATWGWRAKPTKSAPDPARVAAIARATRQSALMRRLSREWRQILRPSLIVIARASRSSSPIRSSERRRSCSFRRRSSKAVRRFCNSSDVRNKRASGRCEALIVPAPGRASNIAPILRSSFLVAGWLKLLRLLPFFPDTALPFWFSGGIQKANVLLHFVCGRLSTGDFLGGCRRRFLGGFKLLRQLLQSGEFIARHSGKYARR